MTGWFHSGNTNVQQFIQSDRREQAEERTIQPAQSDTNQSLCYGGQRSGCTLSYQHKVGCGMIAESQHSLHRKSKRILGIRYNFCFQSYAGSNTIVMLVIFRLFFVLHSSFTPVLASVA